MEGTKEERKYVAVTGARITDADAEKIGAVIEELSTNGKLSLLTQVFVERFVEHARREDSPIHDLFEWDVGRAAELYWYDRALYLIRSVRVTIHRVDPGVPRVVRPVVRMIEPQSNKSVILDITSALQDPKLRHQLVKQALRDLARARRVYADLSELGEVFAAIDRAKQQFGEADA